MGLRQSLRTRSATRNAARTLPWIAVAGLPGGPAAAQEAQGFAEVRFTGTFGTDGTPWQLVERVRPTFEAALARRVRLVATVEMAFAQGRDTRDELEEALRASDLGPLLDAAGCTWPEPGNPVLRVDDADGYLDVDRLYLDAYLPRVDLRVGRQAIHWGSALFLNPTDPFPELLFGEPWRPRRGVNAGRAVVALPGNADLTAVIATPDTFDAVRAAARARVTLKSFDLAVAGAYRGDGGEDGRGDGLVGLDVKGTLGVGLWIEAALHLGAGEGAVYELIAAGLDYSFPVLDGLIVAAQYARNGAGSKEPVAGAAVSGLGASIAAPTCTAGDATALFPAGEADPFAPPLSGRDYLLLTASQAFIPEVSAGVSALQNLGDGTGVVVPTLTVSPLGWLGLSASAQVPYRLWGDGGELKPADEDLVVQADLGALGVVSADLSGLVPDATLTVWVRASF